MTVPLEQFIRQLEDSGLFTADTLQDFVPPKAAPQDAAELASVLVRQKKLTKFQAELICQGDARSLVLDNYVLLEKIGQGGMGVVYKAEHRRMKRIVAIKMLLREMSADGLTMRSTPKQSTTIHEWFGRLLEIIAMIWDSLRLMRPSRFLNNVIYRHVLAKSVVVTTKLSHYISSVSPSSAHQRD